MHKERASGRFPRFSRLAGRVGHMRLRSKLILSFSFLILTLFTVLAVSMIHVIIRDMTESASRGINSVVIQNNYMIDSILQQYEDSSTHMLANHSLFDFARSYGSLDFSEILTDSGTINPTLGSYFDQDSLYSCRLYTSQYVFGSGPDPASVESIGRSGFLETARKAAGAAVWVGGYDFGEKYQFDYLQGRSNYPYKYLITMVRQMNFSYVERGLYYSLPPDKAPPVLLINISESYLRNLYSKDFPYSDNRYLIFDSEGSVVSSNDSRIPPASKAPEEFLAYRGKSGFSTRTVNGRAYLFCYDTIPRVDWTSAVAIPLSAVVSKTTKHVEEVLLLSSLLLAAAALAFAVLLSTSITRPIDQMTTAVQRFAHGDFSVRMSETGGTDFQQLAGTFNRMVLKIEDLIQKNYQSAMREKEAQINMLTLQINPHFLYNTLNTFSMLSLENGDEKTSGLIIGLSQMLSYVLKNRGDVASLKDEIKWLNNYIAIMQVRYEDSFTFQVKAEDGLENCEIPKLILQPFVENAIVHGFADMESGGVLTVEAAARENRLKITVCDNGCGFCPEEVQNAEETAGSHHIGIENIRERIRLLYGGESGLSIRSHPGAGTRVTITLPLRLP